MLENVGRMVTFKDGATIFRQGDQAGVMYVIRSGKVRITRAVDGAEVPLATLEPGDFFGEMGLFGGAPRSATATSVGETTLTHIEAREFRGAIKDPVIWEMFTRMGRRIRDIDDHFAQLSVDYAQMARHLTDAAGESTWYD